ncbi:NAD-dependent epimerase/dehydratase family protein [Gallibacterium salpingitidis]|uniref:NAD-dependent epimerase/dehydratase family protein n=1 Tax=Gallibacterium salpingitidis TaxID=505341 RepID=UPI000AA44815|nr:NAD-dependent epimerase/dehydratase family protein [Gallibacterium salpingitidis]
MKRVLITGIDSFTGIYLKNCLIDAKYDVYGTSIRNSADNILICDIKNKQQIKDVLSQVKPDLIIYQEYLLQLMIKMMIFILSIQLEQLIC